MLLITLGVPPREMFKVMYHFCGATERKSTRSRIPK